MTHEVVRVLREEMGIALVEILAIGVEVQAEERYYVVCNGGGDEIVFNIVTEDGRHTHLTQAPFSPEGIRTVAVAYDYKTANSLFDLTYDQQDAYFESRIRTTH
jgi:hypothetical protein